MRDLLDRRLSATRTTAWSRADLLAPADVLGAAAPAGGVRCWLDLRDRRRARMVFAARSGERFLVRDVELSGNFDELDRAALAEVVELSIEALFENERAGLSRGEAEALLARRAAPPPPSPAASGRSPLADAPAAIRQGTRYELGVFYAAQAQAAGLPVAQGPGLSLARSDRARARFRRPAPVRRRLADGPVPLARDRARHARPACGSTRWRLRAGLEVGWRQLRARLGAGVDSRPRLAGGRGSVGRARRAPLVVQLRARRFRPRWRSTRGTACACGEACSWICLPTAVDYGVDVGGTVAPVFSPWRARPGLAFDVTVP